MSQVDLTGRGAVVTGGGRGIGLAVAAALVGAGARVVIAGRRQGTLDKAVKQIGADKGQVIARTADVTDPESLTALFDIATKQLGTVDILINNAGIAAAGPVTRIALEEWNRLLAVNLTGSLLCLQAVLPGMVARGWGRVINVASIAGLAGAKYIAAYAASKHGLIGLTRSAAAEVAPAGVTVNAICPGYVDTEMTEQSVANIVTKTGKTPEQALEAILATTPQRRLITPDEVAHMALSLCAEGARGINGQAIVIDGGGLLA